MKTKKSTLLTAALVALSLSSPVLAQDQVGTVSYSDVEQLQADNALAKKLKITGYIQTQFQKADTAGISSFAGGDFGSGIDNRIAVRRGRIKFLYDNENAQAVVQFDITEKGLARTFQNIRLFSQMTVLENVMIGRHCRTRAYILGALFRNAATRREERETVDKSYAILEKMGLAEYVNEPARNLPYGAQRRLEIARALATDPFLLLLDEPAAGMNPLETADIIDLIREIASDSLSILLIEHDMKLVMSLSDRIFVIDYGRKIAEGTPAEIRSNPAVIKAYLGE